MRGGEKWRRERDSNPRCLSASLVFKTSAFNRSAISPRCGTSERYYNSFRPARQSSFFKKYGFSEILSLNGGKRKQEPHEMRPCLKRQPSKAQGFTAAAVLEEIHRAGSNLSSHTSHIIRRVQQQAAWRFSIKSPGVRVSFGRLPDCRSRDQSVPKWEKHSKNHSFFGISFWRQAGRRKVFPEIE